MSSLLIRQLELGHMQNFTYLLGCSKTREVFVIDPGWHADKILKAVEKEGLKLKGILATHSHFDHVNAIGELLSDRDIPVFIHEKEAQEMDEFRGNLKKVTGGDRLQVGEIEIEILHTPGHTAGSQCFLAQGALFSGDTLFINYCGRCDLEGGSLSEMFNSLSRLYKLDDKIILYPGHNYSEQPSVPLGEQKKVNPYLKSASLQEFARAMRGLV